MGFINMVNSFIAWIKNPRNKFQNAVENYKIQEKQEFINEINGRFYLQEKNGNIYIVCNSTAIYKSEETETSIQIVEKINKMRQIAIEYKNNQ